MKNGKHLRIVTMIIIVLCTGWISKSLFTISSNQKNVIVQNIESMELVNTLASTDETEQTSKDIAPAFITAVSDGSFIKANITEGITLLLSDEMYTLPPGTHFIYNGPDSFTAGDKKEIKWSRIITPTGHNYQINNLVSVVEIKTGFRFDIPSVILGE